MSIVASVRCVTSDTGSATVRVVFTTGTERNGTFPSVWVDAVESDEHHGNVGWGGVLCLRQRATVSVYGTEGFWSSKYRLGC